MGVRGMKRDLLFADSMPHTFSLSLSLIHLKPSSRSKKIKKLLLATKQSQRNTENAYTYTTFNTAKTVSGVFFPPKD